MVVLSIPRLERMLMSASRKAARPVAEIRVGKSEHEDMSWRKRTVPTEGVHSQDFTSAGPRNRRTRPHKAYEVGVHRKSYYKGQQTTPKPTCTNSHATLRSRACRPPARYPLPALRRTGPIRPARPPWLLSSAASSFMYVSESSQSVAFFPNLSQVSGHAHRQGSVTKIRERRDSQKRVLTDTLSIYLPPNLLLRTQTFFYA